MNAEQRLRLYLQLHHPTVTFEDLEISTTPGYWRMKTPCTGRNGCTHPLHGCLFNDAGTHHTISFYDEPRVNGRFASPYRTWKELYDQASVDGSSSTLNSV